jgi:proteasome lid subunit RPN8/RPN11
MELSAEALAAIYAHAVREYPRECCGVVYQDAAGAWEVREGRNIQDELHAEDPGAFPRDGRTAYHLDVASLFELSRSLQSDEPARLVYHSHCDVGAYFSASDQAAAGIDGQPAYPVEHLVVDVRAEGVRGAVRFGWDGSAGAYVETRRYAR